MFDLPLDQRLDFWLKFRRNLDKSQTPLEDVWELWRSSPFVPHLALIDPFDTFSWPSPWEIIANNKYDDFTRAMMMGLTIKMTEKFKNSSIFLRRLLDNSNKRIYNIVDVDNNWVLNFNDSGPVTSDFVPESFGVENLIELRAPR